MYLMSIIFNMDVLKLFVHYKFFILNIFFYNLFYFSSFFSSSLIFYYLVIKFSCFRLRLFSIYRASCFFSNKNNYSQNFSCSKYSIAPKSVFQIKAFLIGFSLTLVAVKKILVRVRRVRIIFKNSKKFIDIVTRWIKLDIG